ncbi:MAG: epoxyqueuosine reductase, partial [Pseudomonadota bacterium]
MRAQGFEHWGVTDIDLHDAEEGLLQWLGAGFHGEMDYMARHGL